MDERDLIEKLKKEIADTFNDKLINSEVVKEKVKKLSKKIATYIDANEISIESGRLLAQTFTEKINEELFENGKMSEEFAKGVIKPNIERNYEIVSGYTKDVQDSLNKKAGISIKSQRANFNEERADNLCKKIAAKDFEDTKWLLDEPIVNSSQSIVDDTIKVNAEFNSNAGLESRIIRMEAGNCCPYCANLVGTYKYPEDTEANPNVWKRHRFCRCKLEHITKKGIKRINNDWNEEKHKKKRRRELYKKVDKLDKTKRNINKQTIKEIEEKNWSPEFKAKAIKLYRDAHKKKVEFSSHAIARGLDRAINKAGLTEEDLINIAKSKPKYTQGSGRLIYCSKNIYLVRDMETGDFVSILERDLPRKDWIEING